MTHITYSRLAVPSEHSEFDHGAVRAGNLKTVVVLLTMYVPVLFIIFSYIQFALELSDHMSVKTSVDQDCSAVEAPASCMCKWIEKWILLTMD